ncbi:thermostable phytase [Lizonia empirigonia]|nr:thermostable phytase [Lizonia empirigonia]
MKNFTRSFTWAAVLLPAALAQNATITLTPVATGFDSDNAALIYASSPILLANDGSAADGGFRTFAVSNSTNSTSFVERSHEKSGRTKIAIPVYDVGGRDVIFNIPSPNSIIRAYDVKSGVEIEGSRKYALGDWSVARNWRSQTSGENYVFLFGKKMVVQFLMKGEGDNVQILEVQTFPIPIEGETAAVFPDGQIFFSGGEGETLYSFQASESTAAPEIRTVGQDLKIEGLGGYHSNSSDYLLIAHDDVIDVYDASFSSKGSINLEGISDLSIGGDVSVLQSASTNYPSGAIAFAFEGKDDTGIAMGSLGDSLKSLGIQDTNTIFDPHTKPCGYCASPISDTCSDSGFSQGKSACSCFAAFTGVDCSQITCQNDCSSHGSCDGPNVCKCEAGWAGPDCSFITVKAKYETEANGGDGDDPAIWIHPTQPDKSRIITTTKSQGGEGFGVFDLGGKLLQQSTAQEPNNVDIIYGLPIGNGTVDLAYAACRGDKTLCLIEVTSDGSLKNITGGTQPLPEDYEPYGSCTYRSAKNQKQYLFVNNKKAEYLQYELTATANGTLQTSLIRTFTGGSGGQVEGCVTDEANGYIFLGEEPSGIWRYSAEPDASSEGVQIAKVGDDGLHADVEGLTLVPAKSGTGGYIMVSSQGISAYLVYELAPPHRYVSTFTIVDSEESGVDHVSNTDGLAAVGNRLNADFPFGLVVTHDDANELAEGGTSAEASFKFSSLADVLGEERTKALGY